MIEVKNAAVNNLKNVSIDIPLNKYVCLVGKSGSGKSTLAFNVIYSGYYEKSDNVVIDIKPCLFSQKVAIPSSNKTIKSYLEKKTNKMLNDGIINTIISLLNLNKISFNTKIDNLSLSTYNKVRFLKFLYSITDEKLLIIDEIGSGLCYEEAIKIIEIYKLLINTGFSIIGIEHSIPMIINSNYIIELGPDAGKDGGNVTYCGDTINYLKTDNSFVTNLINNKELGPDESINKIMCFEKLNYRNFDNIDFSVPLNNLVCIAGSSGSGKTNMLIAIAKLIDKSSSSWKNRLDIECQNISGKNYIRRPHIVNQEPIGSNCSSIPLTYISLMDDLRDFYAHKFKITSSCFSFNSDGKCPSCKGKGYEIKKYNKEIIYEKCDICGGKRYAKVISEKIVDGYAIGDVLQKTSGECVDLFDKWNISSRKLRFLNNLGLSYLTLGQPTITLSGGESQRVKISRELSKKLGDRSVYILDTPSRGLHVSDIHNLMDVFHLLINKNNTVVIADNHPLVVMKSNYVIYLEDSSIKYFGRPKNLPKSIKEKLGLNQNI